MKEQSLRKCPTGIDGFDEITGGGLPRGRPTLVCGGPGCGKTLFAMEFLVRGARQFKENGVFMSFEEREQDLAASTASLGFHVEALVKAKKLNVEFIRLDRSEIEETGEYDLEGLFIRLDQAIRSVNAKRVVLDTIEALFSGFSNAGILRSELRRLLYWLKERGVTAVVTGERGDASLTRQGLEEYVSDCVILLDQRVEDQMATRRLRIVKYRGSSHGTNEYPFLVDDDGLSVLPITAIGLAHDVSDRRVSSGVSPLDEMLGGKGYYRGSTILVSGAPGSGKTSLAAYFADAACRRGERCLFMLLEEPPAQLLRNMRSIGLDLRSHVAAGRLRLEGARSTLYGLEMHLVRLRRLVETFKPTTVVIDPVSNLLNVGRQAEVQSMIARLIDDLKGRGVTAFLTALTDEGGEGDSRVNVSSLIDTWLLVRNIEKDGERNRALFILKSRGMPHSNRVREFRITRKGLELEKVFVGREGVLVGTAREVEGRRRELERRIAALREGYERERAAIENRRAA